MPDMNAKENKEIVDQWWDDRKVNKYTPAGEEIGKQETKEDREQAENILQSLEKGTKADRKKAENLLQSLLENQKKSPQDKPISWATWAWRAKQAEQFVQDHPDKADRVPAGNDLLTALQEQQTGNPSGRGLQWWIHKILGPQNT